MSRQAAARCRTVRTQARPLNLKETGIWSDFPVSSQDGDGRQGVAQLCMPICKSHHTPLVSLLSISPETQTHTVWRTPAETLLFPLSGALSGSSGSHVPRPWIKPTMTVKRGSGVPVMQSHRRCWKRRVGERERESKRERGRDRWRTERKCKGGRKLREKECQQQQHDKDKENRDRKTWQREITTAQGGLKDWCVRIQCSAPSSILLANQMYGWIIDKWTSSIIAFMPLLRHRP